MIESGVLFDQVTKLAGRLHSRNLWLNKGIVEEKEVILGWYEAQSGGIQFLADIDSELQNEIRSFCKNRDPSEVSVRVVVENAASVRAEIFMKTALELASEAKLKRWLERKKQLRFDPQEPYGLELARKVGEKLLELPLSDSHRDYCGMGFERQGNLIYYGEVYDGRLSDPRVFSFDEFVEWLAVQSDSSLSRKGEEFFEFNQTITRERLEYFIV